MADPTLQLVCSLCERPPEVVRAKREARTYEVVCGSCGDRLEANEARRLATEYFNRRTQKNFFSQMGLPGNLPDDLENLPPKPPFVYQPIST